MTTDDVAALVERLTELHRVLRLTDCSVDEDACLEAAVALTQLSEQVGDYTMTLTSVENSPEWQARAEKAEADLADAIATVKLTQDQHRKQMEHDGALIAERDKRITELEEALKPWAREARTYEDGTESFKRIFEMENGDVHIANIHRARVLLGDSQK